MPASDRACKTGQSQEVHGDANAVFMTGMDHAALLLTSTHAVQGIASQAGQPTTAGRRPGSDL